MLSLSPGSVLQAENRAYGHARTLSEYAGFTQARWVPGALQHGWNPFDGIGMDDGVWRPLPKFVWSDDNVRRGLQKGGRGYRAIGAPWLYLLRMRGRPTPPARSEGGSTIAFPFHATVHTRMVGSHADYARDLVEGEGSRALTVCLQWIDADNPETRRAYEDVGATVVTLGRGTSVAPGHEHFLHRQLDLIGAHDRLVSNRLATCIFYGAAAGLEVGVYGPDMSLEGQPRYADSDLPVTVAGVARPHDRRRRRPRVVAAPAGCRARAGACRAAAPDGMGRRCRKCRHAARLSGPTCGRPGTTEHSPWRRTTPPPRLLTSCAGVTMLGGRRGALKATSAVRATRDAGCSPSGSSAAERAGD